MSDRGTEATRAGGGAQRAQRVWRGLPHERRLAAGAALGLFVTLFLPWYQDTVIAGGPSTVAGLRSASASITGWGAFSFVEAAVLLVAAGVLVLLFIRAEGRAFHVPGGDGGVITAAGFWTCLLILWRIFDKEGGQSNHGQYLTSTGIEWGIFIALGVAGVLAYAGTRIRLAHEPEPPLPGEAPSSRRGSRAGAAVTSRRPRTPRPVAAEPARPQAPTQRARADEAPTQRARPDEAPTQRARYDAAPTQRVRPDEAPTRAGRDDEAPTRVDRADSAADPTRGEGRRPAGRGLGLPDLGEIEFEDPPTARRGRRRRAERDTPDPDPEDQLTIPIDRPTDGGAAGRAG